LRIVYIAVLSNLMSSLVLTATGVDILSAVSGVTATMFNVGPGLGTVGPASNYGHLSLIAKWDLIFTMIAGRLEFFGFLVVLARPFWRK
jgi:trk system potassium uptake protein TrkH